MSECWKCQRPLPEGQVECEYGCAPKGEPAATAEGTSFQNIDLRRPLAPEDVAKACCAKMLSLTLLAQPDHAKIVSAADVKEFGEALERWLKLIARGYEESGLGHWCKRPEGF